MISSKWIPHESTVYGEVMQLYVREAVRGWRQLAAGGAQNAELVLKEATANSILSDYISEHREQLVVDFDEHLDDISK